MISIHSIGMEWPSIYSLRGEAQLGTALTQSIHAGIPCLVFLGYAQNRKIISTFYLLRLLRLFFVFSVAYYLIPLLLNHVLMETMPIPANDDLFGE